MSGTEEEINVAIALHYRMIAGDLSKLGRPPVVVMFSPSPKAKGCEIDLLIVLLAAICRFYFRSIDILPRLIEIILYKQMF